uniref:Carboxylic ester hydrolase n=1 Tax=Crassostrea virginica TaxID=6565 RepID=A0A8B8BVR4_CRAVI|nr:carboxylesterase 5A-like isoform X3 [Crassostrea virginica]
MIGLWKTKILALFSVVSIVKGVNVTNAIEVETPSGWVKGYNITTEEGQMTRFVQIPYAQPPVGNLRFKKPLPVRKWEGFQGISDEQATWCSQWYYPAPGTKTPRIDEDCLFLNIYVPGRISTDRNLSVMVWIHGGGFVSGAGSLYNPIKLVSKGDVIVVTINYRLGLLGFFTMNDPLASGNNGLWDMIEALRWIQNNIGAFGGNPKSVTIFGQSAGGGAVSFLALIPQNEGLFQRAICQSGMVYSLAVSNRKSEKRTMDFLLERTRCKGKQDVAKTLECLQELPVENITNAVTFMDMLVPLNLTIEAGGFLPSIDGELIKENIGYTKSFDDELYRFFRSIDFMSGTTDGEGVIMLQSITQEVQNYYNFSISEKVPSSLLCEMAAPGYVASVAGNVPELSQEICDFYNITGDTDAKSNKICEFYGDYAFLVPSNILLSIHANGNSKSETFQFLVTRRSPIALIQTPPSWFKGAIHGDELPLLFNVSSIRPISEDELESMKREEKLSDTLIQYWTNFAKFGNPNGDNITEWPSYDVNNKRYIIIDNPIHTSENLKPKATDLLMRITEIGRQRIEPAASSANILHNV